LQQQLLLLLLLLLMMMMMMLMMIAVRLLWEQWRSVRGQGSDDTSALEVTWHPYTQREIAHDLQSPTCATVRVLPRMLPAHRHAPH
jgi:hypothetical protein